ncbi:MAG: FTR1 family protein [Ktedonobacteraceae bacterium]|nr:FTR1 family protein [Ktedonobacteraceae bacterium]
MIAGLVASFVLFLREGLEASLIVSILFAALRQLGELKKMRAVWIGIGLAVLASLGGGAVIYITIREYDGSTFQTIFETITYLVAVVLLTSMTFWLQSHTRSLKKDLTSQAAMAGSAFGLGLLAFFTVGREGLETAVFSLALAFQTSGLWLSLGAILGLATSMVLCWLIYRLGYRLDFRIFFRVMGILLLVFAAGLLANAIQNMQELGWISFGTMQLWNTARFLSQDSTLGDILHAFIGYAEAPSILQVTLYIVYLITVGAIFAKMTRKPPVRTRTTITADHMSKA